MLPDHLAQVKRSGLSDPATSVLAVVPSWLISFTLHALLLVAFASGLKSCGNSGLSGPSDETLRQVGLYVRESSNLDEREEPDVDQSDASRDVSSRFRPDAVADQPVVDEAPPSELLTSTLGRPTDILGPGTQSLVGTLPIPKNLLRPGGPFQPVRPSGLAKGETSFFGIRDNGTRFVYVLDASASMYGNPIREAKSELISSVEGLEVTQQFQVIFYNQTPRELTLRGAKKTSLYWASSINKTLARQDIGNVGTGGGTDHMLALQQALQLKPDVLFFLTDADSPLNVGQLDKIKRSNKGRSRIHCIEFGQGPELNTSIFLKRLARQNGGTYHYRDVDEFERR